MAKTAKLKKRQVTVHSRAARRAVSPSDPSLTKPTPTPRASSASPPPHPALAKPHVLAAQNAGISKKRNGKQLSRAQRLRQLKGMERAADNMDKLELKVAKSVGREKKVKERRKGWENVNADGEVDSGTKRKKGKKGDADADAEEGLDRRGAREWVSDEEMDDGDVMEADGEDPEAIPKNLAGEVKVLEFVVPAEVPLPMASAEEESLL